MVSVRGANLFPGKPAQNLAGKSAGAVQAAYQAIEIPSLSSSTPAGALASSP
jgi:hypothetical protein